VTWKDAVGVSWTAEADGRRVDFSDEAHPMTSLTVSALPSTESATQLARAFLEDHGVSIERFGVPYVYQDWSALQKNTVLPSRMVVRFNTTQDGQGIFSDSGMPHVGAELIIDAAAGRVVSGFFTFAADPYRSDYPGLTQTEAEARMVRGGQGSTPNGNVTVTTIHFEWYAIESADDPPTRYLYPALVGEGTIEYADKTTAPYRIVVPLVKQ
jgi:hypothetical protein